MYMYVYLYIIYIYIYLEDASNIYHKDIYKKSKAFFRKRLKAFTKEIKKCQSFFRKA